LGTETTAAAVTNAAGIRTGGSGTLINGGNEDDTFTIDPQANTEIFIDGNDPTAVTGDTLNIDLSGLTTPDLDIIPTTSGGIGNFAFTGATAVHFREVETVNATSGGPYDVAIRGDLSTTALMVGAATGTHIESGTPDTYDARLVAGPNLRLQAAGVTQFSGDNTDIRSLELHGSDDDDTFLITEDAALGLPNYANAAPAAHTNATFIERVVSATAPGIHVEGNTGTDLLRIDLSAAAAVRNVTYTVDTVPVEPNSGVLQVANDANTNLMRVSFDELAPVDLVGPGVAGSDLLVDASSLPAVSSLVVADDADVAGALAPFGAAVVGASLIDGDSTFEDVRFRGYARVIVIGGDGASETIDLRGIDPADAVLTDIVLDADNQLQTDASADTIRVRSLPSTVTARLLGGAGGDSFVLDSDATATAGAVDDTVDNIAGPVFIAQTVPAGGSLGSALVEEASPGDSLLVEDRDDATGDTVRVTSTLITHPAGFGAQGITGYTGAGEEITYGVTDLIETITINSSDTGGDTFNVESTAAGAAYTLNTWDGNDTINVSSDAPTNAGTLDGIAGTLTVNGGDHVAAPVNIVWDGGRVTPDSLAGCPIADADYVEDRPSQSVAQPVGDTLNISDAADTDNNVYRITPSLVVRDGGPRVSYDTIETLNVVAGNGNDHVAIFTPTAAPLLPSLISVTGNAGTDQLDIAGTASMDRIVAGDLDDPSPFVAPIEVASLELLHIYGDAQNDFLVNDSKVPSVVEGGTGDDVLIGGSATDNLFGGAGIDRLFGNGGDDYLFSDQDLTGSAHYDNPDLLDGGVGGNSAAQYGACDRADNITKELVDAGAHKNVTTWFFPTFPTGDWQTNADKLRQDALNAVPVLRGRLGAPSSSSGSGEFVDPTPNPVNRLDVNADGGVSPIDALVVINYLNGSSVVQGEGEVSAARFYVDVNGDHVVSPVDVLLVINWLNGDVPVTSAGEGEFAAPLRPLPTLAGERAPTPAAIPDAAAATESAPTASVVNFTAPLPISSPAARSPVSVGEASAVDSEPAIADVTQANTAAVAAVFARLGRSRSTTADIEEAKLLDEYLLATVAAAVAGQW
jgi:hypothetical protein